MKIGKYTLENEEKLDRVIIGSIGREGKITGGLQNLPNWSELSVEKKGEMILVEYDKLGGLITVDGEKVKNGTFYDFRTRLPVSEPEPLFEINVDGENIEADESEIKVIKKAKQKTAELKAKKLKKMKEDTN